MPRIRTIKPQFFIDYDIAQLTPLTRLLYVGLWCIADRSGRLSDIPAQIKVQCLPYDDINIDTALAELTEKKFIQRYQSKDKKYIQIKSFERHQHCHIKEPESTIPAPCSHRARTMPIRQEGNNIKEGNNKGSTSAETGLPEWINKTSWDFYVEMRKSLRRPLTPRAVALLIKKLDSFRALGMDANEVIDQSVQNSWLGLFEIKKNGNGKGDDMKKKTAEEELLYALKNVNNKTMPPMSEPAVTLFYRLKMKWSVLQSLVSQGKNIFTIGDVRVPEIDQKKVASGDTE